MEMNATQDVALAERHKLIRVLVTEHLGREVSSISQLGRDSNNYAYLVSLVEASLPPAGYGVSSSKPGTKPLSWSTNQIVARISNPDAMLNNAVRVENEVAAIKLMQDALSKFTTKIVPDVYAWNTAAEGHGWIVQEYMRGDKIAETFPELTLSQKEHILDQVAQVFKMIQSYTPDVTGFGGLNFDAEGKVITGGLTIWFGGPFTNYADMYLYIFRKQLELSTTTPLVNGWKGTVLEQRLQKLDQSGGLAKLLNCYSTVKPTMIHGDFGFENILFDQETFELTALLDFDFSHIASPGDEYFYSFMDFHGLIPGPIEGDEMEMLRVAQLNGFKNTPVKVPAGEAGIDWSTARIWQAAMDKWSVQSPAEIDGIGELAAVYWFLSDVCPPYFLLPRWMKRRTEEQQQAAKKEVQSNLDKYLKRWGY